MLKLRLALIAIILMSNSSKVIADTDEFFTNEKNHGNEAIISQAESIGSSARITQTDTERQGMYARITQVGSTGNATITQGLTDAPGFASFPGNTPVDQTGYVPAYDSYTNIAVIQQHNVVAAEAHIYQLDADNDVAKMAASNFPANSSPHGAGIGFDGLGNIMTGLLESNYTPVDGGGNHSNVAIISQGSGAGTRTGTILDQPSQNSRANNEFALIIQTGVAHSAEIFQTGNAQTAAIFQDGSSNNAYISQYASSAISDGGNYAIIVQLSTANTATIYQSGQNNAASIYQHH